MTVRTDEDEFQIEMQIHLVSSHCGHKKEDSELFVRSESHILLMCKTPTVLNVEYLFFYVELLCFWVGPINLEPNTSRRIWYTTWCCDALSCVTTLLAASSQTFWSCMPNGGISFALASRTPHTVESDTPQSWM
jgi:hypothetical protein